MFIHFLSSPSYEHVKARKNITIFKIVTLWKFLDKPLEHCWLFNTLYAFMYDVYTWILMAEIILY